MSHINRLHMTHFGTTGAWFDSFTYEKSAETPHMLLHADNGTGKTTLLSMFFSLFDPRARNFLQTKIAAHRSITDYLQPGRPHFIAIEMQLQGDQSVVIGHCCYVKSGETKDLERFWFLFQPRPGLQFNDLPFYKLGGRTEDYIKSLAEAKAWRTATHTQFPGVFFHFDTISEWEYALQNSGVDRKLIASTIEFSKSEGGIKSYTENIKTEADFVNIINRVGIVQDGQDDQGNAISSSYRSIIESNRFIATLPAKQRQLAQLEAMRDKIGEFVDKAKTWTADLTAATQAENNFKAIVAEILGLAMKVENDLRNLTRQIEEEKAHGQSADIRAKTFRQMKATAERIIAANNLALVEQSLQEMDSKIGEARATLAAAKAAEAKNKLTDQLTLISGLILERDKVNTDSAGELADLKTAGSAFAAGIAAKQAANRARIQEVVALIAANDEELEKLDDDHQSHITAATEFEVKADNAERAAKDADTALDGLKSVDIVLAHEVPLEAKERLSTAVDEVSAKFDAHDELLQEMREGLLEMTASLRTHRLAQEGKTKELDRLTAKIAKADAAKAAIAKLPAIIQIAGEDITVSPDDQNLRGSLAAELERRQEALQKAKANEALAQESIEFINQHGHATARADVQAALAAVHKEGIWAHSAESYLSENVFDEHMARALIDADPARFTGIFVATKDVERAKAIAANLKLVYPVVFSAPTIDLAEAQKGTRDSVTAQPFSAASFNKSAAAGELVLWQKSLAEARADRSAIDKSIKNIQTAIMDTADWARDFGAGKYQDLTEQRNTTREAIQANAELIKSAEEAIAKRTSDIANQEQVKRNLASLKAKTIENLHKVYLWISTHGLAQENLEQVPIYRKSAKEFRDLADETSASIDHLNAANRALVSEASTLKLETINLGDSIIKITYRHDKDADHDGTALSELEAVYGTKLQIFNLKVGDKIAVLEARIEEAKKAETGFARQFNELAAGIAEAEIDARLGDPANAIVQATSFIDNADTLRQTLYQDVGRNKHILERATIEERNIGIYADGNSWHPDIAAAQRDLAEVEAEKADNDVQASKEALQQLKDRLWSANNDQKTVKSMQDRASRKIDISTVAPATPNDTTMSRYDLVDDKLNDANLALSKSRRLAEAGWSYVHQIVGMTEFNVEEPRLADMIRKTTADQAALEVDNLLKHASERVESVKSDINAASIHYEICITHMISVAEQTSVILENTVKASKLPAEVQEFKEMQLIRSPWSHTKVSDADKRARLMALLDKWIEKGKMPNDIWDFATACLMGIANWDGSADSAPLKIEILRPKAELLGLYDPVNAMNFSGGEGSTVAVALFLIMSRIRVKASGRKFNNELSGSLILDNPFGTTNKRSLIETHLRLADAMGFQMIYTTGIGDIEAISTFDHILKMTPRTIRYINGVKHATVDTDRWLLARAEVEDEEEGDIADLLEVETEEPILGEAA